MITKTVECDGAKMMIRRRTHQGRIMILAIRQIFGELYPEFKDSYDRLQIDDLDKVLDSISEVNRQRFMLTLSFSGDCADIIAASGLPYAWPLPGEVPNKEWVREAFAHYMVEGEGGIWEAAEAEMRLLQKPDGPKETWPQEALSKEDLADPN